MKKATQNILDSYERECYYWMNKMEHLGYDNSYHKGKVDAMRYILQILETNEE